MKSIWLALLVVVASGMTAAASDEALCVQNFLNAAHFDVGKADGALGKRSKAQAALLRFFNRPFKLPELSDETAAEWCAFAGTERAKALIDARQAIETVAMSDAKGATDLWRKYDDAANCQDVRGGPTPWLRSKDIKPFDAEVAAAMERIFPSVEGSNLCLFGARTSTPGPEPVIEISSGDFYGDRDDTLTRINRAGEYLNYNILGYSHDRNDGARDSMVTFLLAWADANAFSKGIRQPSDKLALKFDMIEVLPLFIVAFSEVGPTMEVEERVKVGTWLRRLVGEVQYSAWGALRQDNKNYLRMYISLLWGILTKDKAMTDISISEFKDAIYDMRPDGSFPRDSARGGSGLHYSARATMMLFGFAHVARLVGIDLFAYEFEGRSIHTAINWIAVGGLFPDLNIRHATACPDGSNPDFTVENPDMGYLMALSGSATLQAWASVYAGSSYAKPDVAARLLDAQKGTVTPVRESPLGGPFACFAGAIPDVASAQ